MSTYAWVNLCSVLVPFLFSFHPRLRFHKNWSAVSIAVLAMMCLFIPWDAHSTAAGVWGFNREHLWGINLWGLPVEEWLFFICIPYCCLFCYHCFPVIGLHGFSLATARNISLVLAPLLLVIALVHHDRAYTFTAWSLCAIWILVTAFIQRPPWLGRFYQTYTLILIPFLIVNGVLTGTGLEREVVWYNDQENLGIRLLTIPIEDVFYGMLMVGLCTTVYELVLSRRIPRSGVRPQIGQG